jgi:hypothetical protein
VPLSYSIVVLHPAPIAPVSPTRLLTQTKRTLWVSWGSFLAHFWLLWLLSSLDRPWISQLIASVTGTLLRCLPLVLPLRCVYAYITYTTSTSSSVRRLRLPLIVNLPTLCLHRILPPTGSCYTVLICTYYPVSPLIRILATTSLSLRQSISAPDRYGNPRYDRHHYCSYQPNLRLPASVSRALGRQHSRQQLAHLASSTVPPSPDPPAASSQGATVCSRCSAADRASVQAVTPNSSPQRPRLSRQSERRRDYQRARQSSRNDGNCQ